MIERVLLFSPLSSRYQSLQRFTDDLDAAFRSVGCETCVVELKPDSFSSILNVERRFQPDLSVCFNGVMPDKKRGALADFLALPHWAFLVDPPYTLLPVGDSPYGLVSCVDESHVDFFEARGYPRPLFIPHGVSPKLVRLSTLKKKYQVSFLGSCLDYLEVEKKWREKLGASKCDELVDLAEEVLKSKTLSCWEALGKNFDFQTWQELELYVRGKDRVEVLRSLEGLDVHVFGQSKALWSKYLDPSRFHLHNPVDYFESLQIVAESQFVINSVPVFKKGGHERIFSAMLMGTGLLCNRTSYTESLSEDLLLYEYGDKHLKEALMEFQPNLERAKEKVLKQHLWKHRVQTFMDNLSALGRQIASRLEVTE